MAGQGAAGLVGAAMPLGDLLIRKGVMNQSQLEDALEEQRRSGHTKLLGEIIVDLGFATNEQVMEALAEGYGVPFARVSARIADPRVTEALPREFIESHCVLPLFLVDGALTVAVTEPANLFLTEEIERLTGYDVQIVAATPADIRSTLQAYLPNANVFVIDDIYEDVEVTDFSIVESQVTDLGNLEEVSGQSPVIKLVNFLVYQAVQDRASDIHIEVDDHISRVRYRVDGRLVTKLAPPHQMHPAIVSRIKIMAGMDISERRLPQDGDIHVMVDGRPSTFAYRPCRASTVKRPWCESLTAAARSFPLRRSDSVPISCPSGVGSSMPPTVSCWSPVRPAPANPPRSTARLRSCRPTN